jgi:teichuronic acid biosynthesis glycosyltransferase TuaC
MIRIAIVTPMLPVPYDLTAGRFIYEKAHSLSKIADVCVFFQTLRYPRLLSLRPRTYLPGTVGPGYSIPGIRVEAFDYPAIPVVSRAVNGLVSSWVLRPRIHAFNPDIILAYWVYPDGFAATRVGRALRIPCVLGALGSDIHGRDRLNAALTRYTIAKADALITVSEAMRRAAIHQYGATPSRVHTIVNGFNSSVFAPADRMQNRQRLGLNSDDQIVIFVGRFIEAKGLRELISAARQIASKNDHFRLALIGDGVMKAELMELIATAGLAEKVHLPGGLAPSAVAQWISASDVLALPSWSEGYPNVVVEAAACGRPVVATDVGGTREIVNASNGILIPPKDVTALVAALEFALNRQWDSEAIAATIRRSWDDVAKETLQVCASVLARRHPEQSPSSQTAN